MDTYKWVKRFVLLRINDVIKEGIITKSEALEYDYIKQAILDGIISNKDIKERETR